MRLAAYRLSIPLRQVVSHAASQRRMSDPVLVRITMSDGSVGYGETLPRRYVTGETVETVVHALQSSFAPALARFRYDSVAAALEFIEALPWQDDRDTPCPAARAAIELALLDAVLRSYGRNMDAVVQWMDLPGFASPGSMRQVRYSGVLAASTLKKTMRQLRLMYWGGLRSFKLKVGFDGDMDRLMQVANYLNRGIAAGRVTLRVDANGAWSFEEAKEWLTGAGRLPLSCVEQPLAKGCEDRLPELKRLTNYPLMHDESLATAADAERLAVLGVADGFNIRISKCGGLMPSLRLAAFARRHGVRIQLGSMVGETSVLSAAGVRFLEVCPGVEWVEGCYGSLLLTGDVLTKPLRFRFGGRPPRLGSEGLGVDVDDKLIARYAGDRSMEWEY